MEKDSLKLNDKLRYWNSIYSCHIKKHSFVNNIFITMKLNENESFYIYLQVSEAS